MSAASSESLTSVPALEQLLDRSTLSEVCRSAAETFGIALRVLSNERTLLCQASPREVREEARTYELPIEYDGRRLGTLIASATEADPRQLAKLARHVACVLEALLFSGHRAHLASTLHLASSEASYRELAAQNEQLQQAYDKLKELDRLKSAFLATVSHELRTPLTAVLGYSEMLASGMGGELNPTQREFVDVIRAKSDHLLELILSLLDLSKLEQGQLRLKLQAVAADQLALDVLSTVSPTAAKKGIKLERHIASDLPRVWADEARLRQALLNLLDNAVKFTPQGGRVTLTVTPAALPESAADEGTGLVLMAASGRAVQFAVRDTGIGIPQTEQARIFDAFYQVDGSETREHGGAGLGLSIVRQLVEAHGGTLEVSSAPGQGSEFRVRIAASD